jgi:hypothetical protein
LVDASRAIKALSREEKRARLEDLCWDGAERAILDGRVSTVNLLVRSLDLVGEKAEDEEEDPLQAVLDRMSDEEYADYLSLGDEELDEQPELDSATRWRERPAAVRTADSVASEPVAAAAPAPFFPLPTATAPCAYGPADLALPCPPGNDAEAEAAALDWPCAGPVPAPRVIRAATLCQKPAGSGFPQRPP